MNYNKQLRQRREILQRPEKQLGPRTIEQIHEYLIRHFHQWTQLLRTTATFQFDQDNEKQHRCKMFFSIFPHLQSVGNRGRTKQEAKANAIIAFLAHLEKRRHVGLFVPYLTPNLVRYVQREIRSADVPLPDMSINENEYLLVERTISSSQEKKVRPLINLIEAICQVRTIFLWQSAKVVLLYIVGAKTQKAIVTIYLKATFDAEHEQLFNYGDRLSKIFRDENFLREVCQRLCVICDRHLEDNHLCIRGTRENVAKCYDEFVALRREFENSTKKEILPLRVNLRDENIEKKRASSPVVIELSDDSNDSQTVQISSVVATTTHEASKFQLPPPPQYTTFSIPIRPPPPLMQCRPVIIPAPAPVPVPRILRHIVLDGQNIGRNSNDFRRTFSWTRLSNAINYFRSRGHQHIVAFLPLYYRDQVERNPTNGTNECQIETRIREELIQSQLIVFTPSRYNNGKRLTNYDDRFILQYAADNDGIVVSNDNFRDLQHEPAFQHIIRHRILPFATVNNTFMPASDPLGRNGPKLDEFLCKGNTP